MRLTASVFLVWLGSFGFLVPQCGAVGLENLIPGPAFWVIFVLDDILEFGDIASGSYYSFDAYRYAFQDEFDPGCKTADVELFPEALALVHIDEIACPMTDILPLCTMSNLTAGDFCRGDGECETNPWMQNCGRYAIYQAVEQNCARYETTACGGLKARLCLASLVALAASIFTATYGHLLWADMSYGEVIDHNHPFWLGSLGGSLCCFVVPVVITISVMATSGREWWSLLLVFSILALQWTIGLLISLLSVWANNNGEKAMGNSFRLQIPVWSVTTACALTSDSARTMAIQRSSFKLMMRIVQDIPDVTISIIDASFFGWTAANLLDLIVSAAEIFIWACITLGSHWKDFKDTVNEAVEN